ncbi:MAG: hypothetical protein GX657_00435 [Chloroflexi bacterium]|jgi:hypothetical protein|nr:hypothetical protein [Chloroflexota bacterium]
MNGRKGLAVLCAAMLLLAVGLAGCEKASDTPPPEAAQAAFDHVREGYTQEDAALFTQDFAEVMFAGHDAEWYLGVVRDLKERFGAWGEAVYLGAQDSQYTWRVSFDKGKLKVLIVLDEDERVSGLWFR